LITGCYYKPGQGGKPRLVDSYSITGKSYEHKCITNFYLSKKLKAFCACIHNYIKLQNTKLAEMSDSQPINATDKLYNNDVTISQSTAYQ